MKQRRATQNNAVFLLSNGYDTFHSFVLRFEIKLHTMPKHTKKSDNNKLKQPKVGEIFKNVAAAARSSDSLDCDSDSDASEPVIGL